jgi:RHS repeat-associated protein
MTSSTVAATARTYAYNGDGLLKSRTQGTTTQFLWDPSSSPSRLLVQGSDRLVYGLGPLWAVKADGSTSSFARDGGKSVRAEVSGSGTVTASFRYRAYGAIAQSNGASTPSYLGYGGQLQDPSGLLYMRARWYDPATGRFMSRDPAGDSGGSLSNGYGYGDANPMTMGDPTGLAASTSDQAEGGRCDSTCLSNMYPPLAEVNPCASATGPCTYYLTGTPNGTVEVRVNDDGILGRFAGAIGGGNNTVTFSTNLIVSNINLSPRDPIISHELGHTMQAKMLQEKGLSYLLDYLVLIPGNDHRSHPMERDANRRAGLPSEFPYTDTPSTWTSPFHYSVQSHP